MADRRVGTGWWQSDGRIDRLRAAWNDGKTTQAIADELGITTNAVVGQAYRLGLPRHVRRRGGRRGKTVLAFEPEPSTIFERLNVLHAALDQVLRETQGVGKVPA